MREGPRGRKEGREGGFWMAARSQGFIPEPLDLQTLAQQDVETKERYNTPEPGITLLINRVNKSNAARYLISLYNNHQNYHL